MLRTYRCLLWTLTPLIFVYLWARGRRAPAYREHWQERLAKQTFRVEQRDGILIHCVSVGETVAAQSFIHELIATYPQLPVTLSSMTPTARELAQRLFGERVFHVYMPIDTRSAMRRFVAGIAPRFVIILETELWPHLLAELHQRCVPTTVVNARLSERSARGYKKYQWLINEPWKRLDYIATQDTATADRIRNLGVQPQRIEVLGNLKFDFQVAADTLAEGQRLRAEWDRPVWVAASTHAGEDEQLLAAHKQILKRWPEALLILVPRHPERFDQVAAQIQQSGLTAVRRSANPRITQQTQVLLGDTMGELVLWYAASGAAFVGGSLITRGGHNPLEPIATQTPVISGPHVFNFSEIYTRLDNAGAVLWARNAEEVAQAVSTIFAAPEAAAELTQNAEREFAPEHGVMQRLCQSIKQRLPVLEVATRTISMMQTRAVDNQHIMWFDDQFFTDISPELFTPEYWRSIDAIRGAATGRSTAFFVESDNHQLLLRHYYRGGLVGKLNTDRFKREPVAESRAMAEFALLLKLVELDLPVPKPVAAHFQRAPLWGYRADILVEVIANAADVFKQLQSRVLSTVEWRAIGATIRQFHQAGVYHSDLNCHNILLDDNGKVWLVDFDKCGMRSPGEWQQANLQRLLRSLLKEQKKAAARATAFHFDETRDWPELMAGYQS